MEVSIGRHIILSNDYIRGLIEGEGCFTFDSASYFSKKLNKKVTRKIPEFVIAMHIRDKDLIRAVCCHLRLNSAVYELQPPPRYDWKIGKIARLVVREYKQLRDIIIPFFYQNLKGNKGRQFDEWLEKIGNDPNVSKKFKTLYELHKSGFYSNPSKKWFWEEGGEFKDEHFKPEENKPRLWWAG